MAPTITMRPTHATSFDSMVGPQSPAEDAIDERRPQYSIRPSTAGANPSTYPMYPGLQTPSTDRSRFVDAVPFVLNRPPKLSGTALDHTASDSRHRSQMTIRSRSTSYGNIPYYDDNHSLSWKPTYVSPTATPLLRKQKSKARLSDMISSLPGEVLDVIMEMLKQSHLGRGGQGCATCWMRDACSVALCSRRWSKPARLALYNDIQIIGSDSLANKKKYKMTQGCRMLLLRRTLRANGELASMVRSLRVPAAEFTSHTKGAGAAREAYENNIAALIMACPNLERLTGHDLAYNHSFRRLFHALSTRANLRRMDWLIEPTESLTSLPAGPAATSYTTMNSSKDYIISDRTLQPHEEIAFLELHRSWTKLSSLSIQCLSDAMLAPQTLLSRTLTLLPSLQHLHLHNLPPSAFNDSNLLSLPPLQSLTLSDLRGVSSKGFSSFATRPNSQALRRLVLRHVPLTSLPSLARILSNLGRLRNLSLVQSFPPLMPDSDAFILWMMPYLASATVSQLHWDITSHPDSVNTADDVLARSIQAGGFPNLKSLRAPNDPEGVFQRLCRPVERIDLPGDRFLVTPFSSLPSSPITRQRQHLSKSPTSGSLPIIMPVVPHTNLALARVAAQARLDRARENPMFRVDVTDERGVLVETFGMAGHIGTVGSKIHYHLLPDRGSSDEKGGLVDVPDLRAGPEDASSVARDGCSGRWNWREGAIADRREKERWWHTEREPWKIVTLE